MLRRGVRASFGRFMGERSKLGDWNCLRFCGCGAYWRLGDGLDLESIELSRPHASKLNSIAISIAVHINTRYF